MSFHVAGAMTTTELECQLEDIDTKLTALANDIADVRQQITDLPELLAKTVVEALNVHKRKV